MTPRHVAAQPYAWPYDGQLRPDNTALIVIDMQTDFCGVGGYVDVMGYDLSLTQAPIQPIARTLAAVREVIGQERLVEFFRFRSPPCFLFFYMYMYLLKIQETQLLFKLLIIQVILEILLQIFQLILA